MCVFIYSYRKRNHTWTYSSLSERFSIYKYHLFLLHFVFYYSVNWSKLETPPYYMYHKMDLFWFIPNNLYILRKVLTLTLEHKQELSRPINTSINPLWRVRESKHVYITPSLSFGKVDVDHVLCWKEISFDFKNL